MILFLVAIENEKVKTVKRLNFILYYFMVQIRVTDISWKKHTFTLTQDSEESIVDIAERNGVELPYSCKSWACFSCCATIKQWADLLERNKTGEQLIDVDEDEFLCCIGWCKPQAFGPENEDTVIELEMLN